MLGKIILSRSLLFTLLVFVCYVKCTPIREQVPRSLHNEKVAPITREDVELLKEQLQELEADLNKLEPKIPDEVTVVEDEDEDDGSPMDGETVEEVGDNDTEDEQMPVDVLTTNDEDKEEAEEMEVEEEVAGETEVEQEFEEGPVWDEGPVYGGMQIAGENVVVEEEVAGEVADEEEGWEEEGDGWKEGEFVPNQVAEDEDIYLQNLIIKALAVLYRKDADRIDRMFANMAAAGGDEDDIFPEISKPEQEDLRPNADDFEVKELGRDMAEGTFVDRPYEDIENPNHDAVVAMAAEKRRELDMAEDVLAEDIKAIQDQGLSMDELLADLQNQEETEQGDEQAERPVVNDIKEEDTEPQEGAMLEETVDDIADSDDKATNTNNDQPIITDMRPDDAVDTDLVSPTQTGDDSQKGENTEAEELLAELMANLNTSLKNFEKNKKGDRNE